MKIDRQIDHERPEAKIHPHRAEQRARKTADAQHREIEHWPGTTPLHQQKSDETQHGHGNDADRSDARETQIRALRDVVNQAEARHGKRDDARHIQTLRLWIARLLHTGEDQTQCHDRNENMDQKNPLPVRYCDDHTANDGTETKADAQDDSPGRKRPATFATFLKLM